MGKKEDFSNTLADIAIYGGGSGSGKTSSLLREAVKGSDTYSVILKRTKMQSNALWLQSEDTYSKIPYSYSSMSMRRWLLSYTGVTVDIKDLEYLDYVRDFQGYQIPRLEFDELTHFTEDQFLFLLGRNRSSDGTRPCTRATVTADPDSWVKEWIGWWLDGEGYPIEERSGVLRYFIRIGGQVIWEDSNGVSSPEALMREYGQAAVSFTFIPATIRDNKEWGEGREDYLNCLLDLDKKYQERLLNGCWN